MYKILIVDDEKMIRLGIEKSMDWKKLCIDEVYTAASASEALQCLKSHNIDIMITDISMSEMTGLELVEQWKKQSTALKIIVLTGYDRFDYARTALKLRVNDFLLKPIDEDELFKSIQKMVFELDKETYFKKKNLTENDIFEDVFHEFKIAMINNINDMPQFVHVFERFTTAMETNEISPQDTRKYCFELVSAIYFTYNLKNEKITGESLIAFNDSISMCDSKSACELTLNYLQKLIVREDYTEHDLIRQVKRKINEHLSEDISVAGIARELYITPNYLSRLFKQETGEGCNEYIIRKRIMKAKTLLETTNLKAGEIATMAGYRDMNYFSLAFKKHTGVSPTQYRKKD